MQPTSAYIAAPLIAFGVTPRLASETLTRIVAFDRAEASFANITQTNMVQVSSFNGLNGLLLGFDVLPQPLIQSDLLPHHPEVFSAEPLFEITRGVLGTISDQRFPIAPGQHVLCAYKTHHAVGPCAMYGAMAIAIPNDRAVNADLFMEDHGVLGPASDECHQKRGKAESLLESVSLIGENIGVQYRRVLISVQVRFVPEGSHGCVLTAAPYINLAKGAVPTRGLASLSDMSLADWEADVSDRFLGNHLSLPLDSALTSAHA